jgi:hypothetical protein
MTQFHPVPLKIVREIWKARPMNMALDKLVMKNRRIRFDKVRTDGKLLASPIIAYLVGKLILLAGQSVKASRLVHKNYRSFFIGVLKEGEPLKRTFTWSEQVEVSKQLLLPYIAFLVGTFLLTYWLTYRVSLQTMNSLNSLATFFLILIVGPAAIRWTMYAKYRGFRLQAYRHKRKLDPAWSSIRSFRRNAERNDDQSEDDAVSTAE